MTQLLILAAILLPLALDTFIVGAALGMAGLERRERLRASIILTAFEALMPIVGYLIGGTIGSVIGKFAGYTAIAFLLIVGMLLLREGDEEAENQRVRLLAKARGMAIIDLGISISLDELAIGFSLGMLGLPLLVAVIWIGAQAFIAAQAGMRLGSRLSERLRETSECLVGVALIAMAAVLLALKLTHHAL